MPRDTQNYWNNDLPPSSTREYLLHPNPRFRPARDRSRPELYDSRENPGGIGFPSASRELDLCEPNTADPHGYYFEIGVDPWATDKQIRSAVRRLYKLHHPDTGEYPDESKLTRVHRIAEVLTDPDKRERYNRTPQGMRLMDEVYAQEIIDAGLDRLTTEAILADRISARPAPRLQARYDFFALDHTGGDSMLANMWYHHLLAASGPAGYRQVLKVCLTDALNPSWGGSILVVPRSWQPSHNLAVVLFRKAGFDTPEERGTTVGRGC